MVLVQFLAGRFTYRTVEEWFERINSGEITLNGKPVSPEYILQMHDCIEYHPQDIPEPPARKDYRIIFEDESILVIDKPYAADKSEVISLCFPSPLKLQTTPIPDISGRLSPR